MKTSHIRQEYDKLIAAKIILSADKKKNERQIERREREVIDHIEAKFTLTDFSKTIQSKAKEDIERLVTLAIQSVFNRPFTFHLKFKEQKNKVECVPTIKEGEAEYLPEDDMGGGMIDISSLALRIVLWSMESPRSRNIIILDEPFHFCGNKSKEAAEMVKQLSKELGIQIIIATHEDKEELVNIADRAWIVTNDGTMSHVKRIRGRVRRR